MGSQDNHCCLRAQATEIPEQFKTSHLGHLDIDEGNFIVLFPTLGERLLAVAGHIDLITYGLQQHVEVLANVTLVVNDKETSGWLSHRTASCV